MGEVTTVEWQFALFLGVALMLCGVMSVHQSRTFQRAVRRAAAEYSTGDHVLVTGRGRGRLRGAIVLLVVERATKRVVSAKVMSGSTVLARLRGVDQLLGPLADIATRTRDKQVRRALAQATEQFDNVAGTSSPKMIQRISVPVVA